MPSIIKTNQSFPDAVLPAQLTLEETLLSIPGFVGAFHASDALDGNGVWQARIGSAYLEPTVGTGVFTQTTRESTNVYRLETNAKLQTFFGDGTIPLFDSLLFGMKAYLFDGVTAYQVVLDIDGRALYFRPDRDPPIWTFNQGGVTGDVVNITEPAVRWHEMVLRKDGDANPTYGSFAGAPEVRMAAAGGDLRSRDLMIGDGGSISASMDISHLVIANQGTLTELQRTAVQTFLAS